MAGKKGLASRLLRWSARGVLALGVLYLSGLAAFELKEAELEFEGIPDNPILADVPADFLFGASTSAHQIEGGNVYNDWARFESDPSHILDGKPSGVAADHWNRVPEDVQLLEDLGANAYRFSIEWSRVEPVEGSWNEEAWAHYADEIAQLRAADIELMVTLLHFTLPTWIADRGGLTAEDFPERFARFAAEAARRFGADVPLWCTVNEPNVQMYQSYVQGVWPPGVQDTSQASLAFAGLVRGHTAAVASIRTVDPEAQVGAAMNLIVFDPSQRWSVLDWVAAREADKGFNWAFYDSIKEGRISFHLAGFPEIDEELPGLAGSADYFGINYYRRNLVRFTPSAPGLVTLLQGPGPLSDAGVEIYPEGLLRLIRRVWSRYELPIYITENGIADAEGSQRADYLRSHTHAVMQAIGEGIPVKGYFHWSLLDNYEWSEGYGPRFGLYRVDYDSLERHPGPATREFSRLAALLAGPR